MDPKTRAWKFDEEQDINLNISRIQITYIKRENNNFTVEKPRGHHLKQVNITDIRRNWHHVVPGMMHWEWYNITFMIFLLKIQNLNLVMKDIKSKYKEGKEVKQNQRWVQGENDELFR